MRTYTDSGITITYPEAVVFTGNRNIVSISGASAYDTFTIFGDTRDLISGVGEFDISPYLKDLFADVEKNEMFDIEDLTESIYFDDSEISFLDMVFDEIFYAKSRIYDIRNTPKTAEYTEDSEWFHFWIEAAIEGEINGTPTNFTAGLNKLDLSSYSGDVYITFNNTFDDTFDDTFIYDSFIYDLNNILIQRVSCPDEGVVLRYLDHFGVWNQKVFSKVVFNPKAGSSVYNWTTQSSSILFNGLQFAEKTQEISFQIQAQGCLIEECERLSDVCLSDFVHVYDHVSDQWLPVVVTTAQIPVDYTKTNQNININILVQNES